METLEKNLEIQNQTVLAKAVGRRKEAIAQVQLVVGTGQFIINNKPMLFFNKFLLAIECT